MDQQPAVTLESDVKVGSAIVKAHIDGGWALPGGQITHSADVAWEHCHALDSAITEAGGKAKAMRTGNRQARRRP